MHVCRQAGKKSSVARQVVDKYSYQQLSRQLSRKPATARQAVNKCSQQQPSRQLGRQPDRQLTNAASSSKQAIRQAASNRAGR